MRPSEPSDPRPIPPRGATGARTASSLTGSPPIEPPAALARRWALLGSRAARRGLLTFARHGRAAIRPSLESVPARDYAPGDDPRQIDWRLCARRDELLVRPPAEPPPRRLDIVLDASRSMALGCPPKLDLARGLAVAAACAALGAGWCVRLLVAADRLVFDSPVLSGVAAAARATRWLQRVEPRGGATDLRAAIEAMLRRRLRPGCVILLGDLGDPAGLPAALDLLLEAGYDPQAARVFDPREAESPPPGDVELFDVETGARWRATITPRLAARYRRKYAEFDERLDEICRRRRVPLARVACDQPVALAAERLLLAPAR